VLAVLLHVYFTPPAHTLGSWRSRSLTAVLPATDRVPIASVAPSKVRYPGTFPAARLSPAWSATCQPWSSVESAAWHL